MTIRNEHHEGNRNNSTNSLMIDKPGNDFISDQKEHHGVKGLRKNRIAMLCKFVMELRHFKNLI